MRSAPAESILHRLHPWVKMTWLVGATAAAVLCSSVFAAVVLVVAILLVLWLARIPPRRIPGGRFCVLLAVALVVINTLIFRRGQSVLGPFTAEGIRHGILAAARIIAIILASRLFVATTDPTDLGQGLIALGLPYRWAYALITALRLEPLFSQQARMVYWAQLTRGVRYDTGPLLRRWLMLRRLLLPLIVSSLRAAADVSGAMENRCFGMYKRRTSVRPIRFEVADALAIAGGLVFFVVLSVAI